MPQDETIGPLAPFEEEIAEQQNRRVWHDGRWWYSVIDVVALLTGNQRPRQYWFDMKRKIDDRRVHDVLAKCRRLKVPRMDEKMRMTDCADFATIISLVFYLPALNRRQRKRGLEDEESQTGCDLGIYAITNTYTQERYIGSSRLVSARLGQHRLLLRNGKHHARRLQRAWNQYGEEAFHFQILERVASHHLLASIEQQYLDRERPAYNSSHTATNTSSLPPISAARFHRVLQVLYEASDYGKRGPVFGVIRDAILVGALRPGPHVSMILDAEHLGEHTCEALSASLRST